VRLNYILVLLIFLLTNYSIAQEQESITIEEAIDKALNNNAQLKFQQYKMMKAEGYLTNAGIIPNPQASYYKEDLSDNNASYNEWTVSGSMPLNFLWERWSAVNSASYLFDAEKFEYEKRRFDLISDVKSAFVSVHFYNEINNAREKALSVIDHVKQTADAREDEGEISGYDLQRILLEYLLYQKNYSESKTDYNESLSELLLLISSSDSLKEINTVFNYNSTGFSASLDSLIQTAKENRADLKAAQLRIEGSNSALTNEQLKIIPDVSFNMGYKEQSDNLKGLGYGFSIGIPLFDRNQGNIETAEAELNQHNALYQYLLRKTVTDVETSYKKFKDYEAQLNSLKQFEFFNPEDIISTAEFSYAEGEMNLVELIDAIRAYTDSFLLTNELLLNYYQSLFELERAIGKELTR
jgi:outer membrane protein, heavy metal efflux system